MENQNKLSKSHHSAPSLTDKEIEIVKALHGIKQLTSYPLTDIQLIEWSVSIIELLPYLTPDKLKFIIDKFKMGIFDYNPKLGIQNIFEGYRLSLDISIKWHREKIKGIRVVGKHEEEITQAEHDLEAKHLPEIKRLQDLRAKISKTSERQMIY